MFIKVDNKYFVNTNEIVKIYCDEPNDSYRTVVRCMIKGDEQVHSLSSWMDYDEAECKVIDLCQKLGGIVKF